MNTYQIYKKILKDNNKDKHKISVAKTNDRSIKTTSCFKEVDCNCAIILIKVLELFVFDPYNKTSTLSFAFKFRKMGQLSQAYQEF